MAPEIVVKNGLIIDPKQDLNKITDIEFMDNKVSAIGIARNQIDVSRTQILDASGCLVIPGIIDMHAHVYWGGTSLGVDPDALAKRSGTTCWLDVGSAGPGNFHGFRKFIAENAQSRVYALLHISFAGIYAFGKKVMVGESGDLRLLDPMVCTEIALENTDLIRGIKVRIGRHASAFNGTTPLKLALEAADIAGTPLMCHIDEPPPTIEETLDMLRPGDVLTHAFRPQPNAPINGNGKIRDAVMRARDRGVLFDIGHGMGSFSFDVAEQMLEQGFEPDVISSDVHALCIDGPAFDNLETMTKFRHLGMPLEKIVKAVTQTPATFMDLPDIGHLGVGALGDATILREIDTEHEMVDVRGNKRLTHKKFEVAAIILNGKLWSSSLS